MRDERSPGDDQVTPLEEGVAGEQGTMPRSRRSTEMVELVTLLGVVALSETIWLKVGEPGFHVDHRGASGFEKSRLSSRV